MPDDLRCVPSVPRELDRLMEWYDRPLWPSTWSIEMLRGREHRTGGNAFAREFMCMVAEANPLPPTDSEGEE